jgi:hypothetical protein
LTLTNINDLARVLGEQGKHMNTEETERQTLELMEAARVISVL